MGIGKVQARGQVTLPREIRRAAGIRPGDTVVFRVAGPGSVELKRLPNLRLSEALERYQVEGPVDDARDRVEWQRKAAGDVRGGQGD